jgi:trigger factor
LAASKNWKTVDEMKEGMREELQKYAIEKYISEYMTTEVAVSSVPDELTKYQEKSMLNYYREYATSYGMEFEEFLSSYAGFSGEDELIEANRESNLQSATYALVSQAVAEDADISVKDKDLEDYFTEYAGSSDYSTYEEEYGLPYLKQMVLYQKVLNYIKENAVFV